MDTFGWVVILAVWMVLSVLAIWLSDSKWARRVRDNDELMRQTMRDHDEGRRR